MSARDDFLKATFWHGDRKKADAVLAAHPDVRGSDIHVAAALGDHDAVTQIIAQDPSLATKKSGPLDVDPLTQLCFSVYLKDSTRSDGFVRAASALLDAGASANAGFYDTTHTPPEWEPVLYGAAGVAHHTEMTRLLLSRGAKPNDGEVVYHSPESGDNGPVKLLVETGKLSQADIALMLIRKCDWHDFDGVKYLLPHLKDLNARWFGDQHVLNHALSRDDSLEIIDALIDAGADPRNADRYGSGISLAIRRGRADVLRSFDRRGIKTNAQGVERLLEAANRDDGRGVARIRKEEPKLVDELLKDGGTYLSLWSLTDNTPGVGQLLDLGVPVDALYKEGDGYFGIPPMSTALHVAAWMLHEDVVRLLIERGANVNAKNAKGDTALTLAKRASTDSHWTERASPTLLRLLEQHGQG